MCTATFTLRMDIRSKVTWALSKQVVSSSKPISDEVQRAIGNSKKGGLVVACSCFLISESLSILHHVYGGYLSGQNFGNLCSRLCGRVQIFGYSLLGRLHIRDEVQKHVSGIAGNSPKSPRKHDIGLYLRMRRTGTRGSM